MKLTMPSYGVELLLKENCINLLVIENRRVFSEAVGNLWRQSKTGEEGLFVLSDKEKIYDISKNLECIINPFAVDCNDKKIVTKILQQLKEECLDFYYGETVEMRMRLISFAEKITSNVHNDIEFDYNFDLVNILKAMGLRVGNNQDSQLGLVIEYISLLHSFCGINIFVFVNIKNYLTHEEIQELYNASFLKKIHLILLESEIKEPIDSENAWLIDDDSCIISLN